MACEVGLYYVLHITKQRNKNALLRLLPGLGESWWLYSPATLLDLTSARAFTFHLSAFTSNFHSLVYVSGHSCVRVWRQDLAVSEVPVGLVTSCRRDS